MGESCRRLDEIGIISEKSGIRIRLEKNGIRFKKRGITLRKSGISLGKSDISLGKSGTRLRNVE